MTDYRDPLPDLGKRLPPELYREIMTAPPILGIREAAKYLGVSVSTVRALLRDRHLVGVGGARKGSKRCAIPRSSILVYWERQYLSSRS